MIVLALKFFWFFAFPFGLGVATRDVLGRVLTRRDQRIRVRVATEQRVQVLAEVPAEELLEELGKRDVEEIVEGTV